VKTALITGIYGQDGTLLSKFLINKGYRVIGIVSTMRPELNQRLQTYCGDLEILDYDLLGDGQISNLFELFSPNEIYNLAGRSQILECEADSAGAFRVNTELPLKFLNILAGTDIRFYQASSSEIFGNCEVGVQNEETLVNPRNMYGITKAAAHFAVGHYRRQYNVFACSGIMYNHESEFRGDGLVTSKIIDNLVRIKFTSDKSKFSLGNIDSKRDWGFAGDYVKAMWMMLQQEIATDFVVATNSVHSVRDFLISALNFLELNEDLQSYVNIDEKLVRQNENGILQGDYTKIKSKLGWEPSMNFDSLVQYLIKAKSSQINVNPKC
jgi:GDPmannose 4,6-dehydratase